MTDYRSVKELTDDEREELKQRYMIELVNEGTFAEVMGVDYDEPSYYDMAFANDIIPDSVIDDCYEGISFVHDDFFCNMREEDAV